MTDPTYPMIKERFSLRGYLKEEIEAIILEHGMPRYRAKQLCGFLFNTTLHAWEQYTSLPQSLLQTLAQKYRFLSLDLQNTFPSHDGSSTKYLLKTHDGK